MLNYFGKNYGYETLVAHAGDFSQLGGIRRYAFTTGQGKGVEAADIRTGSGLAYTVLLDRGMDIAWAEYKGIPFAYISHAGVVASAYYEPESNEWLRSFTGGLLTTCGLSNVGPACEVDGVKYGQHGRISKLPGENILVEEGLEGDGYILSVKGQVRQTKAFVEDMVLHRSIRSELGKNQIMIRDTVENRSMTNQPFMLLYHLNFGFPLLNGNSGLYIPNRNPSDGSAMKEYDLSGLDRFKLDPDKNEEFMYYADAVADENGYATAVLTNDRDHPELAVKISYTADSLNRLGIWKNLQAMDYVLCIEPCNCMINGLEAEKANGTLKYIKPMGRADSSVILEVIEGEEPILNCLAQISAK